jgi:hypothetical protein
MYIFKCPACGFKHSVRDEWPHRSIRCAGCAEVFPVRVNRGPAPSAAGNGPETGEGPASWLPAGAVEAAVPGALAGAAAGLVAGLLSGGTFGAALAGLLFGFIIGFAVGTPGGALLGACGWLFRAGANVKAGLPMALFGAVVGCVSAVVIAGPYSLPLAAGGAVAAGGANLWALVCTLVDRPDAPRPDLLAQDGVADEYRNGRPRYRVQ